MKGNIMDIKKPLHERLRNPYITYSCAIEDIANICGVETDCSKKCSECIEKAFAAIADEIEENYEMRAGAYGSERLGIGADGLPIYEGDEVYVAPDHARDCGKWLDKLLRKAGLHGYSYGEMRLAGIHHSEVALKSMSKCNVAWCHASWLTHTPPDTQKRIDADKQKYFEDYWGCEGVCCDECSLFEGESPEGHYGVRSCILAQGMDIARRHAELDALLGGDE